MAARLDYLPRYSQRLSSSHTGGLAWPRWIDDERFRIRDHVAHVALPAPGGHAELCEWAADFYSHRLGRTRPLWEMALIEGLPEGRWAIAHKTHHCLVDAVGSVDVAYLLLDTEPNPPERSLASPAPRGERRAAAVIVAPTATADRQRRRRRRPRRPARCARGTPSARGAGPFAALGELIIGDEVIGAPHTSLAVPIGSTRRFAVVSRPLADLKTIRRRLWGSVNDVVLAACTSGLRELFLGRGEPLPRRGLRAMVPMNIRQDSEKLMLGNRISSLFVDLPIAIEGTHERH